jgi:hypothetical protein
MVETINSFSTILANNNKSFPFFQLDLFGLTLCWTSIVEWMWNKNCEWISNQSKNLMGIEGVLFSVARIALDRNFNVLHTYIHTICITLKLKVKNIGMRRSKHKRNPIETHGRTNQKFVVSSFKLQQACDNKHHFIFIRYLPAQINIHYSGIESYHRCTQSTAKTNKGF